MNTLSPNLAVEKALPAQALPLPAPHSARDPRNAPPSGLLRSFRISVATQTGDISVFWTWLAIGTPRLGGPIPIRTANSYKSRPNSDG